MTQRAIYTKLFETVLPTVLDKLTTKEDYPSPASKAHVEGKLKEAITYASSIAWKASFTWAENMTYFMHMDDDKGIAGTPNESLAKMQGMSLTEYKLGFEDPEGN